MAVLFNIRRSGVSATNEAQVMEAAAGDWVISEDALQRYGNVALAILQNQVVGAFDVLSWFFTDEGRARLELRPSETFEYLVGQPSPRQWKKGQANPVALVDLEPDDGPVAVEAASAEPAARRQVHRICIETKGLGDQEAAALHHALIVVANTSGRLHNYSSTSLVREMSAAKEAADIVYVSAKSPRAIR